MALSDVTTKMIVAITVTNKIVAVRLTEMLEMVLPKEIVLLTTRCVKPMGHAKLSTIALLGHCQMQEVTGAFQGVESQRL